MISTGERKLADVIAARASGSCPGTNRCGVRSATSCRSPRITAGTRLGDGARLRHDREPRGVGRAVVRPPAAVNAGLSGSLDSEVPFATLSKQGRRFVWNAQAAEMISEVMGEDAVDVIRVYVGLESAPTEERTRRARDARARAHECLRSRVVAHRPADRHRLRELRGRQRARDAGAGQLRDRRDAVRGTAVTVVARPRRRGPPAGAASHRRHLGTACATCRPSERPKVVLFGESLGAWTSQDAFIDQGTQGLVDAGIDYAIWIGTPHFSQWKEQVLRDGRPDVEPELIGVFNDIGEWEATPAGAARAHALRHDHAPQRRGCTLRTGR